MLCRNLQSYSVCRSQMYRLNTWHGASFQVASFRSAAQFSSCPLLLGSFGAQLVNSAIWPLLIQTHWPSSSKSIRPIQNASTKMNVWTQHNVYKKRTYRINTTSTKKRAYKINNVSTNEHIPSIIRLQIEVLIALPEHGFNGFQLFVMMLCEC